MKIPIAIPISVAVLIAGGIYIRTPRELSGDKFLSEFKRTSRSSSTSFRSTLRPRWNMFLEYMTMN